MSYINGLKHVKRRPAVVRLTGAEAIKKLNEITEAANKKIAAHEGRARHFEKIATEVANENRDLLRECERLTAENRELRAQLDRARKRARAARVGVE